MNRNYFKVLMWGALILVIVLLTISVLTPNYRTVCYEYDADDDSTGSDSGSEATNEEDSYDDFDEDSEVVCHYASTSGYNNYYWHSTYVTNGRTYNQGTEVSPNDTSKYNNVNDLTDVENSNSVQKSGESSTAESTSKSSTKSTSSGKSSSKGSSSGKSSSSHAGGKSGS